MSVLNYPWCIIGDFNAISSLIEHKGGTSSIILVNLSILIILFLKTFFLMLILLALSSLGTMADLVMLGVGPG